MVHTQLLYPQKALGGLKKQTESGRMMNELTDLVKKQSLQINSLSKAVSSKKNFYDTDYKYSYKDQYRNFVIDVSEKDTKVLSVP